MLAHIPLKERALVVDCTSGEPAASRALAASLRERCGGRFVDAPVSGGPTGAEGGTLTSMLGGDEADCSAAMEWARRRLPSSLSPSLVTSLSLPPSLPPSLSPRTHRPRAASRCEQVASYSRKVVRCGPSGAGDAVKAVNNVLNSAHLLLATEGLLALQAAARSRIERAPGGLLTSCLTCTGRRTSNAVGRA